MFVVCTDTCTSMYLHMPVVCIMSNLRLFVVVYIFFSHILSLTVPAFLIYQYLLSPHFSSFSFFIPLSLYFTFPYFTLLYFTLLNLTLLCFILSYLTYLTLPYFILPYLPYFTLSYLTLPYFTLPYFTLPYLRYVTLPYLTLYPTLLNSLLTLRNTTFPQLFFFSYFNFYFCRLS